MASLSSTTTFNWAEGILANSSETLTHGNNQKTRILIISTDPLKDNQLKDNLKKDTSNRGYKANYQVIPVTDYCHASGSFLDENTKKKFLLNVKHVWKPTVVLIDKTHNKIYKALRKSTLINFEKAPFPLVDYNSYETLNITVSEPAILTFSVPSSTLQVRDMLKDWVKESKVPNTPETRVLWIDGSHGEQKIKKTGEASATGGPSGLTDEASLNHKFYSMACNDIGIVPNPAQFECDGKGNFLRWEKSSLSTYISGGKCFPRPDICEDPVICSPLPQDSLLNDPQMNNMKFNVLNLANYHSSPKLRGKNRKAVKKRMIEFVEDVKRFNPTVIFIGFCFSSNGDVALAMRAKSIFSLMLMEHDLREITGIEEAKLHPSQREILEQICNGKIKHCILAGSNGTGKTLIAVEFVKDIGAAVLREDTDVNFDVIVCQISPLHTENPQLVQLWKEKHFEGIQGYNVTYENGKSLCDRFQISYDKYKEDNTVDYFEMILDVCDACEEQNKKKKNAKTIILMDEVMMHKTNADNACDFTPLSKLEKFSTVCVALCINPYVRWAQDQFTVKLPENTSCIYSTKLTYCYRNSKEIRKFLRFFQDHYKPVPSSVNDELGEHIPPSLGCEKKAITWIQCGTAQAMEKSTKNMLQVVEQMNEKPKMVILYCPDKRGVCEKIVKKARGQQKAFLYGEYLGCESDVVLFLTNDHLPIEPISRPRRKLVIITGMSLTPSSSWFLNQVVDKQHTNKSKSKHFKCPGEETCPWSHGWTPLVEHLIACHNCGEMSDVSECERKCHCGEILRFPNRQDWQTSEDSYLNPKLPKGWEKTQTADGRTFYINHDDRTTHWLLPDKVEEKEDSSSSEVPECKRTLPHLSSWPHAESSSDNSTAEPDLLDGLDPTEVEICQQLQQMGFPLSRIAVGVKAVGRDTQKVINFCLVVDQLVEDGHNTGAAEKAASLHDADLEASKKYLEAFNKLSEMGFPSEDIEEALAQEKGDYHVALEVLMS